MDIIIRKAQAADLNDLLKMYEKNYLLLAKISLAKKDYDDFANFKNVLAEKIKEVLENENEFEVLIAKKGEQTIGFAIGQIQIAPFYYSFQKIGFVCDLFVEEKFRNKGVGKKLTVALFDWFSEKGAERIELEVEVGNVLALNFWKGLEFYPKTAKFKRKL